MTHHFHLPRRLQEKFERALMDWHENRRMELLWNRDANLWTGQDESRWLGWLSSVDQMSARLPEFKQFQDWVQKQGFSHVLLMGMGGSSLGPEVYAHILGRPSAKAPRMHVLDSTDPSQVRRVESGIDYASTLFIVASKSGSTLEPNLFRDYFFARASEELGSAAEAASRFVAITDPGSQLQKWAEQNNYAHIFLGEPSIGGRYSALSPFGLIPLAAQGVDLDKFLKRTRQMVEVCGPKTPLADNPGATLGLCMGVAHNEGRDKLTLILSPSLRSLGSWLEQLVAESLGKQGKSVIPIDGELSTDLSVYGDDRLFVYVGLTAEVSTVEDDQVRALEKSGHPVVRLQMQDVFDLGQEMFRWEIATAVAGSLMRLNPFDQPDVEASKLETRKLTDEFEATGHLPHEKPFLVEGSIRLYTDERNWDQIKAESLQEALKKHLARIRPHDYFGILAYLEMNKANAQILQGLREKILAQKHVATCVQFGPRFLHSTGQAYKGGSDRGVFLQITCDEASDLTVPERKASFGVVKAAQARGDFQVLAERGRRLLRLHLGADVKGDLLKIQKLWL